MDVEAITDRGMTAGAAQKRAEFVQLVEFVADLRPNVVVEIGTMAGGTLSAWCECAADRALIVSVDLPGGEWGGGYRPDEVPRLQGYARAKQLLELVTGDSHHREVHAELVEILDGRPIDFLFIDGDHTFEGVSADFSDYSPLVRKGGWVGFHDILDHPQVPGCDVSVLWEQIAPHYETREFCVPGDERGYGPWGGIGVLRWRG